MRLISRKLIAAFAMLLILGTAWAANPTEATAMPDNSAATTPSGVVVEIKTSLGDIEALLYNDTPLHRDNFLKLVENGTYDGVLFHRVIDQFMVQTGDPDSKNAKAGQPLGSGDPGYTIDAEIQYPKYYHKYGALAAARMGDDVNPEFRSSGSQFYIVTGRTFDDNGLAAIEQRQMNDKLQNRFRQLSLQHADEIKKMQAENNQEGLEALRQQLIKETEESVQFTPIPENIRQTYRTIGGTPHLDGAYTVFGEVLKGMDVVEKIQKAATDSQDRPLEDIRIISVKVKK